MDQPKLTNEQFSAGLRGFGESGMVERQIIAERTSVDLNHCRTGSTHSTSEMMDCYFHTDGIPEVADLLSPEDTSG